MFHKEILKIFEELMISTPFDVSKTTEETGKQ
jgi:hypothetical protein